MSTDVVTEDPEDLTAKLHIEYETREASLPLHREERVGQLRDEAVGRLDLDPAPSEFALFTVDGRELEDDQTLVAAGVEADAHLLLVQKKVEITCNGRTEPFEVRAQETVGKLREAALQRFGIVSNPHLYGLFNEAGHELNDNVTLKQAGVDPGALLVLRQSQVRGGAR